MRPADDLRRLRQLADARHRDPKGCLAAAEAIAATAEDAAVLAAAWQAAGLAQYELGRLGEAARSYRRAVRIAASASLSDAEATARANLASTLVVIASAAEAEREIEAAKAKAGVASRGLVALRESVVLQRRGRLNEALEILQRAERWLAEAGDEVTRAVALLNRGVNHAYQGNIRAAVDDLRAAEKIARRRDLPMLVAMATHNLGFHLGRWGETPDALTMFDRAKQAYAAVDAPARLVAVLEADRCEVLLLAGLVAEAQAAARWAVDAVEPTGDRAHLMECRLLYARSLLAGGDYPAATAEAARAARGFGASSRRPWAAQARYVGIQAEVLEYEDKSRPPAGLLARCRRVAGELEAMGWPVEAVHVHTFAGRIALSVDRPDLARDELRRAADARTRGTAALRAQAWLADALLLLAEGDRGGARRALGRGMAVVDDYRASLGATELRVHAAGHGADLARLGIRLAIEDRRPAEVLRWAERWRAGALRRPSVRPPDDTRLADDLSALRQVRAELRELRLQPPRSGGDTPAATDRLVARVAALEESIRNRSRQARDVTVATGRVDLAAIRAALGPRRMVEYVSVEGQLFAVSVSQSRVRLHALGSAHIAEEKNYLLFAIRRLMTTTLQGRKQAAAAAEETVSATAARLDQLLLGPLGLSPGEDLVIVPTGELHGLPWSTLPSLAGRPATIAPSAALWLGGGRRPPTPPFPHPADHPPAVALVAGPQLPWADEEVRQVSTGYPTATTLAGRAATAGAVIAALEGAEVAHLAAHGSFRADSPLFSSVLLADGPLTVYELERLRRAPQTVVLASCDAAVSAVHAGDELLGTATALIGLGVRSVIAPVTKVPDGSTPQLMVALHSLLRAGLPPAAALAKAGRDRDGGVAAAFVCIGCDEAGPAFSG